MQKWLLLVFFENKINNLLVNVVRNNQMHVVPSLTEPSNVRRTLPAFKVPVDDVVVVEILESFTHLTTDGADLCLCEGSL